MAPSIAAITIYGFGMSAFAVGVHNLLFPTAALASLSLPADATPALNGNSLAAIAMGIYYTLAAYQRNRAFFLLTIPMRLLTASVFWRAGGSWKAASSWEAGGAVLTAAAILWEARIGRR